MESTKDVGKNVEENEYQEAWKLVSTLATTNDCYCEEYDSVKVKLVNEIIDKEIPKKPVGEKYYELCPLCYNPSVRSDYASNYELKRCHECGQKLDWSNDE